MKLIEETPYRFRIEQEGAMRVPGIVFASRALLPDEHGDMALAQVANVATLPGIVRASYAMPDVHWGYGFPIGGVAATDIDNGGVVSPGGVGFDISCGVRLLVSRELDRDRLQPRIRAVMDHLDRADTPRGRDQGRVAAAGPRRAGPGAHRWCPLRGGAGARRRAGLGAVRRRRRAGRAPMRRRSATGRSNGGSGRSAAWVPATTSSKCRPWIASTTRPRPRRWDLAEGTVCVMIHTGSRGLGHQICTDHVRQMEQAMGRYSIQRARSPVGVRACPLRPRARHTWRRWRRRPITGAPTASCSPRRPVGCSRPETATSLDLLYDVSHNLAKLEEHPIDGRVRTLCVHRKGATRSLPPHHPDVPAGLAAVGQPVLIPGTMGTASYVLAGVPDNPAFFSTAHGAGRIQSRHQAARHTNADALRRQPRGIRDPRPGQLTARARGGKAPGIQGH